ncbi:MAG: LD-carboxypeptidase, partial [Terracoccus sp.]
GRTWGGCIEVVQWLLTAGRFPADPATLAGGVLLIETSEELIAAQEFGWILRSLGERGLLSRYNPEAVVCVGVPFGHTRPQWILPYGGMMTVDGATRRIWADYH